MKKFFLILLISICNLILAQKENIDAKIIFSDGRVSNAKIPFRTSIFHSNEIYENSITQKKIFLINADNKKEKHLFSEFKSIEFVDLKGKTRLFERPIEKFGLFELVNDGKNIKWYRDYTENAYDHSQDSYDIFIRNDGKYEFFNLFTNYKKKLKELTSDKKELADFIDNCNFFNNTNPCLQEVFKKYNE